MGDVAYAVHHTDATAVQFVGEMDLFHRLTLGRCERTACIYVDTSYRDAASWLTPNQPNPPCKGGWYLYIIPDELPAFGELPLAQIQRAYQKSVCCPHCGRWCEFTPAGYPLAYPAKL